MAKQKTSKHVDRALDAFESLADKTPDASEIVRSVAQPLLGEAQKVTEQFVAGLFGIKTSVEIYPGQSVEMGKKAESTNPVQSSEFSLLQEIRRNDEQRLGELRGELRMISKQMNEVVGQLSQMSTQVDVAVMQAQNITEASIYHVNFLTKFLRDLLSFKKEIGRAKLWLQQFNARGAKKGWVANYKQHGAKYLLSNEHYMSRSAG